MSSAKPGAVSAPADKDVVAGPPPLGQEPLPTLPSEVVIPEEQGLWPTLAAAYSSTLNQSMVSTLASRDLVIEPLAAPTPPTEPPAPSPPVVSAQLCGQLIGKYRIVKELGRGGMGAVFEARHETIGQRAAVKVLFSAFSKHPSYEERFFYEARMVNLVKHPGLVQVFDHGQLESGTSYILMEFLDGQALQARLPSSQETRPRLSLLDTLRIGRQIALILDAVHAKGIVHREAYKIYRTCLPSSETPPQRRRQDHDPTQRSRAPHFPLRTHLQTKLVILGPATDRNI